MQDQKATGEDLPDGLHFRLSEDVYHKFPALSSSGIKNLMVSPMDFWARSWMNPLKDEDNEETVARFVGKAYHKRILEGSEEFERCYARKFFADPEIKWMRTVDDIKAALREIGLPLGGTKAELIARLEANWPEARQFILDVAIADYEREHDGKKFIDTDLWNKIQFSASLIEHDPELCRLVKGGYPEVSVIWTDEATGVRMKARMDYLKRSSIVDLKTFANQMGRPVKDAIYYDIANNGYHIPVAVYTEAALMGAQFAREGKVFGEVDKDWLKTFSLMEKFGFYFLYQQKGIAPVTMAVKFPVGGTRYGKACAQVFDAKRLYKHYSERFGSDAWIDQTPIEELLDDRFPPWF